MFVVARLHVSVDASRDVLSLKREIKDAKFHAAARGRRHRRPRSCTCTATPDDTKSLDRAIAGLALPALGTELIDPLLSVCDTAFVGRLGAEPLAGVGIASSVFTYAVLFFNFLSTASAPLIAQALAKCAQKPKA
jgi:Na+-driven multidrug efflux pump